MKKDKKKEDKKNEVTLEDLIEKERAALGSTQTKVTLETFLAWKKRKIQEKKDAAKQEEEKKRNDFKAGRQIGLSGREMFSFNPDMAKEYDMEDGDEAIDSYSYENEEDQMEYKEINLDILGQEAQEVDGSGTKAPEDRFKDNKSDQNGTETSEEADGAAAVPINENLFLEEDLEGLDDELNDLELDE